jgi:hypothetical protein
MNWDALGAIGETVGAIAVVVTLAYFAIQLRQTRKTLEAHGTDRSMALYSTWRTSVSENSDLAEAIGKANMGETLAEKERIQLEASADELFFGSTLSYEASLAFGAIHQPDAEVRYLMSLMESNPGLIPQWRRFRPFIDEISSEFGKKVDAQLADRSESPEAN